MRKEAAWDGALLAARARRSSSASISSLARKCPRYNLKDALSLLLSVRPPPLRADSILSPRHTQIPPVRLSTSSRDFSSSTCNLPRPARVSLSPSPPPPRVLQPGFPGRCRRRSAGFMTRPIDMTAGDVSCSAATTVKFKKLGGRDATGNAAAAQQAARVAPGLGVLLTATRWSQRVYALLAKSNVTPHQTTCACGLADAPAP